MEKQTIRRVIFKRLKKSFAQTRSFIYSSQCGLSSPLVSPQAFNFVFFILFSLRLSYAHRANANQRTLLSRTNRIKRERALNMLPSSHDFRLMSCLPPFLLKLISTYQLLKSAWERKNIDLIWRILGDNNEVMDIKHITRHTTHNLRMYFYNSQS